MDLASCQLSCNEGILLFTCVNGFVLHFSGIVLHRRFHYSMMAWLPTYFTDAFSLSLKSAAYVSLLPPAAAIASSAVAGPAADALIARGVPVVTVRRLAQSIAFLGPTACLLAATQTQDENMVVGAHP